MPRVVITQPDISPQPYRFELEREVVKIGRHEENDIVLTCGSTSSFHAEMRRTSSGFELVDLGSTNGMSFAGARQERVELRDGMVVKLGDTEFGFTLTEDEQAQLKPASASTASAPRTLTTAPKGGGAALATGGPAPQPFGGSPNYTPASSSGAGGMLLFLGLTVLSVLIGLGIRHHQETGNFILDDLDKIGQKIEKTGDSK